MPKPARKPASRPKARPAAKARSGTKDAGAANPFGPGLVDFLSELREENSKAWFQAHAERYEREVREPALAFIRAFRAPLRRVSRHFLAEDRKVGGSLMRIHRDVRFAKDKSPYKTNLGIQFRHEAGRDVHAPGIYLHVDPDNAFLGAGMWHPEPIALGAVREAIVADPRGWKKARDHAPFATSWTVEGDSLKRAPKGFDPEHPLIDDLRRKDHIAVLSFPVREITRKDLVPWITERVLEARPYLRWLTRATGLPF